jgi:YYY domain-containing protein
MNDLLIWTIAIELLGIVALPLVALALPHLPDRGWALAKPLAVLLVGIVCWVPLAVIPALPYTRGWIVLIVLLFAAANAMILVWRPTIGKNLLQFVRQRWPYVALTEGIFVGAMWLMGWLRALNPQPEGTEKFMDLAFLASIMRAAHMPPPDPWLAGYPINYYYFGHFLLATIAKLLGTAPQIAFNAGIALTAGLVACAIFGLAANLTAVVLGTRRKTDSAPAPTPDTPLAERAQTQLVPAIPFALFAVAAMLLFGNLRSFWSWWQTLSITAQTTHQSMAGVIGAWLTHLNSWGGDPNSGVVSWWSTRAIPHTITEFPDFSFLLADLHAHVLALPYTIVAIGVALHLWLSPARRGVAAFGAERLGWLPLVVTGLTIGALYLINGWDLPTYLLLAGVALALHQWNAHGRTFSTPFVLEMTKAGAIILACCFLPYLPFYLHFISPSQGIGIVTGTPSHLAVPFNFAQTVAGQPDVVPASDLGTRTAIIDEIGANGVMLFLLVSWLVLLVAQRLRMMIFPAPSPLGAGPGGGAEAHAITLTMLPHGVRPDAPTPESTPSDVGARFIAPVSPPIAPVGSEGITPVALPHSPLPLQKERTSEDEVTLLPEGIFLAVVAALLAVITALTPLWNWWTFIWAGILCVVALWLVVQPFVRQGMMSDETAATTFPLVLVAVSVGLIALCEVVYLHDVFAGGLPRMNTVFKFYYQVWTMFALVSAPALAWLVLRLRERASQPRSVVTQLARSVGRGLWALVLLVLVAGALMYPLGTSHAYYPIGQKVPLTLDGLANNTALDPGDSAAIRWLQANVAGSPTIVEAIDPANQNDDYSYTYGRISAYTGLPTIIGWTGHEEQWRVNWFNNPANAADYNARLGDLATIYTSPNRATVLGLLTKYQVRYVIVGPEEQQTYGTKADLSRFRQYLTVVYDTDGVVIYQVPIA